MLWLAGFGPNRATAVGPIPDGTVMVSTGNGLVTEFDQNGKMLAQLDTTTASPDTAGSVFDASGNFFVTDFEVSMVTKFDPTGASPGAFGSGYNMDPESIVFDSAGHAYVGQADGTHQILEFNAAGTMLNTFSPTVEARGTDWIDLASDQCTMFYTSEGVLVKRFNVCTNAQLADFNISALPGAAAYAHRILLPFQVGAGGVLVADTDRVVRLNSAGAAAQTYAFANAGTIFALNLDPDGTSFWTADLAIGTVYKIDISSGTILKQWSAAGVPSFNEVGGLAVKGELIAAVPTATATVTPTPTATATARATSTSTVTATLTPGATATRTATATATQTVTPTATKNPTPTATPTTVATATSTPNSTPTPRSKLQINPGRVDFGQVAVGHARRHMVTVRNKMNVAVDILGASISPTVPPIAIFTITSDTCSGAMLRAEHACHLEVSFKSLIDADLPGIPDNDTSSAVLTITDAQGRQQIRLTGSMEKTPR